MIFFSFFIINFVLLAGYLFYKNLINFYVWFYWFEDKNYKFEIVPESKWLISYFFDKNSWLFKKLVKRLTQYSLSWYKIYRRLNLPASLELNFFWTNLITDIFIFWIEKDNNFSWKKVKFYVSSKFLSFYNSQISDNKYFPKLTVNLLKNLYVKVTIWKSYFFNFSSLNKKLVLTWNLWYFDEDLPLIWLGVDYGVLKKYNLEDKLVPIKFVWYAKDLRQFIKIKHEISGKVKFISYDSVKIKAQQNTMVIKYWLIVWSLIVGLILFVFLIYILYSSFYMEKDIWYVYFVESLSFTGLIKLIFSVTLIIYLVAFGAVLLLVSLGYWILFDILTKFFVDLWINIKLVFIDLKFLFYVLVINIFLIACLSFITARGFKI